MFISRCKELGKKYFKNCSIVRIISVSFLIALLAITTVPENIKALQYQTLSYTDEKYKVTLTYDDESSIPEGSTLHVEEYELDKKEYEEYVEQTKETLEWDEDSFSVYSFLNFYILDKDGNNVIPKNKVKVKVQLVEEKKDEQEEKEEDISIDDTQFVVLNEEENGVSVNEKEEDNAVVEENHNFSVD